MDMVNLTQEQLSELFRAIQERDLEQLKKVNVALKELTVKSKLQVEAERNASELAERSHNERNRRD